MVTASATNGSPLRRQDWIALAAIVALALMLRVAHLHSWQRLPGPGDAYEYHLIASRLLAAGEFRTLPIGMPHGEYAVRPPGYPAFLAATYWMGERWLGSKFALVRPFQVTFDLLSLLMAFALARRLQGRRQALMVAGLYAVYPAFWWAAALEFTENVSIFLWVAAVLVLTVGFAARRARAFLLGGIIVGLSTLVRPSGQAFLPFMLAALVWTYGVRDRRWVWHFAALVVGFTVVVGPWMVRNYQVFHRPVALTSIGGLNFWAGNYLPYHGRVRHSSYWMVNHIARGTADEMEADRRLWAQGLHNILHYLRHEPLRYLELLWLKFRTFWMPFAGYIMILGLRGRGLEAWQLHHALLLLGLVGLLTALLSPRRYAAVLAALACGTAIHVLIYAEPGRYALFVMPLVMILAAAGLGWLFPRSLGHGTMELPVRPDAETISDLAVDAAVRCVKPIRETQ